MRAAIDDVHHRHRHHRLAALRQVFPQRLLAVDGRSLGIRQRHRKQRIGAQAAFVFGAVQVDHDLVELFLVERFLALERVLEFDVHVADGLAHALAEITLLVAIAQFHRFAAAGGGAGRHGRAAHHAGIEIHVGFDRGIAA
jgi:hypothetical protein